MLDGATRFSTGDLIRAAGIEASALKNWIAHGVIHVYDAERVPWGSREQYRFRFERVLFIAVIAELNRHGFPPQRAVVLAQRVLRGQALESGTVTTTVDLESLTERVKGALGVEIIE